MGVSCQLVFRGDLAGEATDVWMKRIIALADGKSAQEIAQALYLEELRAGGAIADIGLWRSLFFNQVQRTLKEMSDRGYIRLESHDFHFPENRLMIM